MNPRGHQGRWMAEPGFLNGRVEQNLTPQLAEDGTGL